MSTGYESNYPASGYASESQIRNEFEKIQQALEDTISRSGTSNSSGTDNAMSTFLNMDGNDIINAGSVYATSIIIGGVDAQTLVDEATAQADRAEQEADRSKQEADRVEQEFRTFVASSGYQFAGDYASGIEITQYNQLVRDENGEFWRVSGQVDLPYVTTGAGVPEDDALVSAGDAVLRQDLANPNKGAAIVARGVVSVDSIADLMSLPEEQRREDLQYLVASYHGGYDTENPYTGPKGGGVFYWSDTSEAVIDGGTTFGVPGSTQGRFYRTLGNSVSIEEFGAKGDGIYDCTTSIQAALDYAQKFPSSRTPHITAGTGRFRVTEELAIDVPGTQLMFSGQGTTGTQFLFDGVGGNVFRFGNSQGYHGGIQIQDIHINMGYKADLGLDITYCRYSWARNVRITGIKPGAVGMSIGQWVTRIENPHINGKEPDSTTPSGDGILIGASGIAPNNVVIEGGSITSCDIGVRFNGRPNQAHISTTFDYCYRAAIYAPGGYRMLTISGCYFEACGNTDGAGLSVIAAGGGESAAIYSAPIVLSAHPDNPAEPGMKADIHDNLFAQTNSLSNVVVSDSAGLSYYDNHTSHKDIHSAVRFVERGCFRGKCSVLDDNAEGRIGQLVSMEATPGADTGSQYVIAAEAGRLGFTIPNALDTWDIVSGTIEEDELQEFNGSPAYLMTNARIRKTIHVEDAPGLSGGFIRMGLYVKGVTGVAGATLTLDIDRGSGFETVFTSSRAGSEWTRIGRSSVVHVPDDAVSIRLEIKTISSAAPIFVGGVRIVSAAETLI